MARYLHHLTLDTGHLRRSVSQEVDDGVQAVVGDLLEGALAALGEVIPFPAPEPAGLSATADGRALLATLWAPMTEREAAIADAGRRPWRALVTLGVAPTSITGARLWPMLVAAMEHEPATLLQRPQAPWAGAVLHVDDTALWVGDAERAIAWAWLVRR